MRKRETVARLDGDGGTPHQDTIEKRGDEYVLLSGEGKVLGRHKTKEAAKEQERAIEASKHRNDGETVERFDVARLGRVRRTPQGFLQVEARLTRTGVLAYRRADGTLRRELRLPEEVFSDRSMATLKGAPVTNRHDAGMIGPENVRSAQVGHVGEDVRKDGDRFILATMTIQDREAIDAVLRGDAKEVSAGYHAQLQWKSGEYQGEKYDCIQRGITYNHAGIGPEGWGRAGSEVSMRLDGEAALSDMLDDDRQDAGQLGLFIQQQMEVLGLGQIQFARETGVDEVRLISMLRGFDNPTGDELQRIARRLNITVDRLKALIPDAERRDKRDEEILPMKKVTIHLDGATFVVELPEALADDFERRFGKLQTEATAATERADAAEAERDELKGKLDSAEDELKTVKSPEHIQERIRARVKLEDRASRILGPDEKLDGKSDLEVMQAAIAKAEPDFKLDGKGEESLTALFELLSEKAKPAERKDGGRGAARRAAETKPKGDDEEERLDAAESRKQFQKRSRDAWKAPLAASKQESN